MNPLSRLRQRLMNAGGDRGEIEILRRELAATEDPTILRALAVFSVALLLPLPSSAATSKNVLILRGESPDLPGGNILIETIETTIRTSGAGPVEFYIETLDTGRFSSEAYDERFGALLAEKYADIHVDLVVAVEFV